MDDVFDPRTTPDYFGDDVYAAYGRAMAQAQHFELALGLFVFGVRAISDEAFAGDPATWVQAMQSGRRDELAAYATRLVRMTAGARARELQLPATVTDDVTTIITERNILAHHWFREYAQRHGKEGARERAIGALEEFEERLRRRAVALWLLLEQAVENAGTVTAADATRTWVQVVSP